MIEVVADKLNLGCGSKLLPPEHGWINVDIAPAPGVSQWDLDLAPWPWPTGAFEIVLAEDIFEHVDEPVVFMTQCWRVLRPGGELRLRTTHWQTMNAHTDPTHKRFPTEETFDYWVEGTQLYERHNAAYGGARFSLRERGREGQEQVFVLVKLP